MKKAYLGPKRCIDTHHFGHALSSCLCLPTVHSLGGGGGGYVLPLIIIIIIAIFLAFSVSSYQVAGLVFILIPVLFTLVVAIYMTLPSSEHGNKNIRQL
jgi:hypothetical protein